MTLCLLLLAAFLAGFLCGLGVLFYLIRRAFS